MLQIHTKKGTISSSLIIRRKGWRDRRREQSPWVRMGSYSLDKNVRISGRTFLILSPVIRTVGLSYILFAHLWGSSLSSKSKLHLAKEGEDSTAT